MEFFYPFHKFFIWDPKGFQKTQKAPNGTIGFQIVPDKTFIII